MEGSKKPIVVTGGTLFVQADADRREMSENSLPDLEPVNTRGQAEVYARGLGERVTRVLALRRAPWIFGRGGSGVKLFGDSALQSGKVMCVDGGRNCTMIVHVGDVTRGYLLAAQKAKAGRCLMVVWIWELGFRRCGSS